MKRFRLIKERLLAVKPVKRYITEDKFRGNVSLCLSLSLNLIYSVWEIVCGIYYRSFWFATLGCYYILLSMLRIFLMWYSMRGRDMGWRMCRLCGALLLMINLTVSGIVALAVLTNQGKRYAGYLIYAVAAFSFYKITVAVKNIIKHRKSQNASRSITNAICFSSAAVSMLSLEIAMILQFGDDPDFFRQMTILTGAGVCAAISFTGIYIIVHAEKYKKND